jgi:hypothetical protein
VVRWTFTGDEIDAGALERHFLGLATALSAGGVPYDWY